MSRSRPAHPLVLAFAAAATLQTLALVLHSDAIAVAALPLAVFSGVQCLIAAVRSPGAMRRTFVLATVASFGWLAGLVVMAVESAVLGLGGDRILPSDVVLLTATAVNPTVLASWPRAAPGVESRWLTVLDALLCASALLYVGWPLVIERLLAAGGPEAVIGVGYVLVHTGTLTLVLVILGGRPRLHPRALVTAAAALALFAAGDVTTAVLQAEGSPAAGHATFGLSAFGAVLVATAALRARRPHIPRRTPAWLGLLSPWLPLAVGLAVAVVIGAGGGEHPAGALGTALFALLLARMAVTAADHRRLVRTMEHRSRHDPLTELANRDLATDRLRIALTELRSLYGHVGVLMLDLDGFKLVNDTLGHSAGDHLLRATADVLRGSVRESDTVARLGGDEFIVVLPRLPHDAPSAEREAVQVAERVRAQLATGIEVAGHRHATRASIGVVLCRTGRGTSPGELLGDADLAMYAAKRAGRDRIVVFEPALRAAALGRAQTEQELVAALDRGELRVHFQPVVHTATGEIPGAEALVRWQHPDRGLLAPGAFLDVAEQAGLMPRIGEVVLREALAAQRGWAARPGGAPQRVSVNLSAAELRDRAVPARIRAALDAAGCPPEALVVEVTERLLIDDLATAAAVLEELSDAGVLIAFDDFGSGHSGLSHLRDLPVDIVKLDRSFVADIATDRGRTLVASVVALARGLGKGIIAEGVEHPAQARALRALGCEVCQGYLFARPLPPEAARPLMARGALVEDLRAA